MPAHDDSHGWVLGKAFGIIGVIVASKAAVDGLSEQRDEVVSDVATGAAFLEIVGSNMGKAQGIIQLSNGQESGIGSDGGTVKLQTDFGVELEPERGFVAVTHQVASGVVTLSEESYYSNECIIAEMLVKSS